MSRSTAGPLHVSTLFDAAHSTRPSPGMVAASITKAAKSVPTRACLANEWRASLDHRSSGIPTQLGCRVSSIRLQRCRVQDKRGHRHQHNRLRWAYGPSRCFKLHHRWQYRKACLKSHRSQNETRVQATPQPPQIPQPQRSINALLPTF